MSKSTPLRLDWHGDAEIPAGAHVITTEVQWLEVASELRVPNAQNVIVRGSRLCEWASEWWQTAGGRCEEVLNAVDALLSIAPGLGREGAREILEELGESWHQKLQSQWQLAEVLSALLPSFGDEGSSWQRKHSDSNRLEIAANWLLWLEDQKEFKPTHALLIKQQTELWQEGGADSRELFPATSTDAKHVLEAWLALKEGTARGSFAAREVFPLPIPLRWQSEAQAAYASALTLRIDDGERAILDWWRRFERSNIPLTLRKVAAKTLAEILEQHSHLISSEILLRVEPLLDASTLSNLRTRKPPKAPNPFPQVRPSQANAVLDWVTQQYLPFRAWQSGTSNTENHQTSLDAAHEFGEWFLEYYANAISGAAKKFLQIHHAATLRMDQSNDVVFWVIADGLGWLDAQNLSRLLAEQNARLSLASESPCFSTVPTITSFAKQSLRWSTTPDSVQEMEYNSHRREVEVAGHKEASNALQGATAGDLIIWTPLQPDKTYHENADVGILKGRVEGALAGLAQNIVEASLAAPEHISLKIVITTDHGRLIGSSERIHSIPEGFTAHGRAAYGENQPVIENNLRWLSPDVYRLGKHVVIPMDDNAFLTNASEGRSGRGGTEKFPHGGVFPEEVVVPWLVFERDAQPVKIQAELAGKGRSERSGIAELKIVNSSRKALMLDAVELSYGRRSGSHVRFQHNTVPPFQTTVLELEIQEWPSPDQARETAAIVVLRQPDGRVIQATATVDLTVEALQTREENILDDMF